MAKKSTSLGEPTYLNPEDKYVLELHSVVKALRALDKKGLLDKFVRASKAKKAPKTAVTFDAATVNFVKDFMAKNGMHKDSVGKHIINAKPQGGLTAAADRFHPCTFR
jgi:hypothetical protein